MFKHNADVLPTKVMFMHPHGQRFTHCVHGLETGLIKGILANQWERSKRDPSMAVNSGECRGGQIRVV